MKLSLNWLADFIKLDGVTPAEYAARMTETGSKVEGITQLGDDIVNVVVGRVESTSRHPDADKLILCQVNIGESELVQIVTGATNVTPGVVVPVALAPSTLPGGVSIKKGKLRGQESNGMLCSMSELQLEQGYGGYYGDEIMLLREDEVTIGADIRDVLHLRDTVVEFELTSNRPDCLGVVGLARETGASFSRPVHYHIYPDFTPSSGEIDQYLAVRVEDSVLCPRYAARMVKNVKIAPSPMWLQARLRAAGVRAINNIVDITNYVMLEYGQPMHAFDYASLGSKEIVVRAATEGEKFRALDSKDHVLRAGMTVITNGTKPVALAGVIGGENSEIKDTTATVVFECANFSGPQTRAASRALGIRTESSGKFEKGLDPHLINAAIQRACELVEQLGGEVMTGAIDVFLPEKTARKVEFSPAAINALLGTDLSREYMADVFRSLEFEVHDTHVVPPTWRADVTMTADLAEEVARIYGYNNIAGTNFKSTARTGLLTPWQKFRRGVQDELCAMGLNEIKTFSFLSPRGWDKIRITEDSQLRNAVKLLNPLGEDTSIMRTTLLPSMLDCLERNSQAHGEESCLFELSNTYIPNGENELPQEKMTLCVGSYGADFYALKGMVETLLQGCNITNAKYIAHSDNPSFHPGRCAQVTIGDQVVGVFGELHPEAATNFDIRKRIYIGEFDVAALFELSNPERKYQPLPKYPSSSRDFAFLCDISLEAAAIEEVIRKSGGKLVRQVELFDVYTGKQVPQGQKSMAFGVLMRADDRTLTDAEVDKAAQKIIDTLAREFGVTLRG